MLLYCPLVVIPHIAAVLRKRWNSFGIYREKKNTVLNTVRWAVFAWSSGRYTFMQFASVDFTLSLEVRHSAQKCIIFCGSAWWGTELDHRSDFTPYTRHPHHHQHRHHHHCHLHHDHYHNHCQHHPKVEAIRPCGLLKWKLTESTANGTD